MHKQTGTAKDMALKENLKRIRKAAKLSQAQLAEAAKVSQQSISRLENGDDLTSKHLPKLARALNVSPSDLDPAYAESPQADDEFVQIMLRVPPDSRQLLLDIARKLLNSTPDQKERASLGARKPAK